MYFSVFSLFFSPFDLNSFFEEFDHALVIKAQLCWQNMYVNPTEEQTVWSGAQWGQQLSFLSNLISASLIYMQIYSYQIWLDL